PFAAQWTSYPCASRRAFTASRPSTSIRATSACFVFAIVLSVRSPRSGTVSPGRDPRCLIDPRRPGLEEKAGDSSAGSLEGGEHLVRDLDVRMGRVDVVVGLERVEERQDALGGVLVQDHG